ncbi:hypothetical protein NQ315_003935 [Exocentrus adspersus]|uniref:Uncharacterized protein n=1 Tax=Exocentrus adspersus TaxID=1586481 RepID=A0AAV8VYZ0_9CUCU|nr:hypothetical protein NQ315_003935 [Exocentrus adspersus]
MLFNDTKYRYIVYYIPALENMLLTSTLLQDMNSVLIICVVSISIIRKLQWVSEKGFTLGQGQESVCHKNNEWKRDVICGKIVCIFWRKSTFPDSVLLCLGLWPRQANFTSSGNVKLFLLSIQYTIPNKYKQYDLNMSVSKIIKNNYSVHAQSLLRKIQYLIQNNT